MLIRIRILFLTTLFCNSYSGFSQNIDDTKAFIVSKIESFTSAQYKSYCGYGDDYNRSDLAEVAGKSFDTSVQKRLLFYERDYLELGTMPFIYIFDVKGISGIETATQKSNSGNITYFELHISFKPGYFYQARTKDYQGQFINLDQVVAMILVNGPMEEVMRVKKALLHLCKLYGGSPLDDNLFKE